jgi:hypothetical protein
MTFKKYDWSLLLRIGLLFAVLCGAAWLLTKGMYAFLVLAVLLIALLVIDLFRFSNKS